jgi:pimeloyl-ACP methyl ester carboxylesterase
LAVSSGLADIARLVADGQVAAARERLRRLEPRERALLSEELGEGPLLRAERSAAVVSRGPKRGRVVLVPGMMGSLIDVRRNGAADRVWLSVPRLARGRFANLELGPDGATTLGGREVAIAGLHPAYLPLILHLDQDWAVLPFAYDWRMSIDASADLLAWRIEEWARGERVHVVAHGMGGMVARDLSLRHPKLWSAMDGRLIMLGTPNRGSYAIPLALVGQEWLLKMLALVDLLHDRREIGRVLRTFPGAYEMLPSQVELEDDHELLYSADTWGEF